MPIVFRCPTCAAELTLGDTAAGRRGKCPHCKGDILVPGGTAPGTPPPLPPQPDPAITANPPSVLPAAAAVPQSMGAHLEPHRGSTIKVVGILSLFVLPVVLGPLAWIWARQDLKKMADGVMDPTGKEATETGKICGMISSIISLGGLALTMLILMPMFCCCGAGLFVPRPPMTATSGVDNNEIQAELAAEAFLDDLKEGDFAAAKQKTSKGFQSRQGEAGLRALVSTHPILSSFESRNTDTKTNTPTKLTLEASFKDRNDKTITGTIDMVKEGESWKVDRLTIP
jgi:hypothetical protein